MVIKKNKLSSQQPPTKKRKIEGDDETLEEQYEDIHEENEKIKVKNLLPIKTKSGFVPRRVIVESEEEGSESKADSDNEEANLQYDEAISNDEDSTSEKSVDNQSENIDTEPPKPISVAQLFAQRNKILSQRKLEIGVLSSQILENPDEKVSNLRLLMKLMDDQTPEVYLTIRKLAIISLLEVFKDVLPTYKIRTHQDEGIQLKKSTFKLRKFETELLQNYKKFLQKLEKACMALHKKGGNMQKLSKEGHILGELALQTMCDLIITHPYFNFAENIAQVLVPFLNYKEASIREIVKNTVKTLFKDDKRQEITLKIVRLINTYLKTKVHNVKMEMLEVLLDLRLENVNLEQDKEINSKQKKLQSKKQNLIQISKKERKRKKQLQRVENELLEAKAEENKAAKQKKMVEITKIVFGIYFRILKNSTNNKALGKCLEGLAKFSNCISIDYYVDIVNSLDKLLQTLGFEDQLHCIQTVFAILSGGGEYISLDPNKFYNNLYKNLLQVSAGSRVHNHQRIVLNILCDCLVKRRRKITNKRMIGFTKRLALVCLQLLHHGTIGTLGLIRNIMQLNKNVDILLDTDKSEGDGIYLPEVDDPEYANASSTTLHEMVLLSTHYHPVVSKFSKNIAAGVPSGGELSLNPDLGKMSPPELFDCYDMTEMAFSPPVPVPKKVQPKNKYRETFADSSFEKFCKLEVQNHRVKLLF